ncbi:hypothetical protein HGI30_14585 [Paenibacillus albicereus]|uniref:Uncharacterized protein n=1 Tax=Paenibacillus albicereus TaxID=2726185 RepID=A0A6H2GZ46_9BACL|nr:hypothetical protein [Paenibacillus albicereus]QJC52667.1 hypothetical protein HGI30_14585 [Paenibacillus albicereus]
MTMKWRDEYEPEQPEDSRPNRWKAWLRDGILAALLLAVCVQAAMYFSTRVFELDGIRYKLESAVGETRRYAPVTSREAGAVIAAGSDTERVVTAGGYQFRIEEQVDKAGKPPAMADAVFRIAYPGGEMFWVELAQGLLLAYDAKGEFYAGAAAYSNGAPAGGGTPADRFHPAGVLAAAYPDFQERRGQPIQFALAVLLLVLGWALLRFERVGAAFYWLSLDWFRRSDPEPEEGEIGAYKLSGIALLVGGALLGLSSL